MATQTDVQQLIQSLVPSSVNNGNPNTIYNASPLPATSPAGEWYIPDVNPAATLQALNLSLGTWVPPAGTGGGIRPNGVINFGGITTNPNWVPSTNPNNNPNFNPGGGGGGGTGGTQTPGGTAGGGGGGAPVSNGTNIGIPPLSTHNNGYFGSITPGGGFTGSFGGNGGASGLWGVSPALARQLGMNADGSISWQQILDMVTEPFISGNYWNSQTNSWNQNALGEFLGQAVLGLPGVSSLMDAIARSRIAGGADETNSWIVRNYMENVQNDLMGLQNQINAETDNRTRQLLDALAQANQTDQNNRTDSMINALARLQEGRMNVALAGGNFGNWAGFGNSVTGAILDAVGGSNTPTTSTGDSWQNAYGASPVPNATNVPSGRGGSSTGARGSGMTYAQQAAANGGYTGGGARGASGMATRNASFTLTGDAARAYFGGLAASSDAAIKAALAAEAARAAR